MIRSPTGGTAPERLSWRLADAGRELARGITHDGQVRRSPIATGRYRLTVWGPTAAMTVVELEVRAAERLERTIALGAGVARRFVLEDLPETLPGFGAAAAIEWRRGGVVLDNESLLLRNGEIERR